MTDGKKRLLTGLQPSGTLHIGNYFGAIKPFLELSEQYESFLMVVDYHALTTVKDGEVLRQNTLNAVRDYLAAGVDPEKVIIFKQSDVLQHMELAWILECQVTVPFLMQAHSYKDKLAKGLEANAGLFNYPMLMAADILLYDTDVVPVGEDQRQHIEYAREAANKFNLAYGETFKMPEENIYETIGTIPGTDGQKMSKSYNNTIPLFGSIQETKKPVMSIVTDSEGDFPEHVFNIHKLFKSSDELKAQYEANKGKYSELKNALAADIEDYFSSMREKRASISDEDVRLVLSAGSEIAKEVAEKKMSDVRQRVGVTI